MSCCCLLQYQEDDSVTLWVNKAAPYNNPQETYSYYSLPFCRPADGDHKWGGLGEVLGGNDLIDSRIHINFKSQFFNFLQWSFILKRFLLQLAIFSQQEIWRKAQFANLNWMHQKWHSLSMQLTIRIGLNFLWVQCFMTFLHDTVNSFQQLSAYLLFKVY